MCRVRIILLIALLGSVWNVNAQQEADPEVFLSKVYQIKESGQLDLAVAKLDSAIAANPKRTSMYENKFGLLIGTDDEKAYACLRQMLNTFSVTEYNWFMLIYTSYGNAKKPDYALAHEVADRAIRKAQLKGSKGAEASALLELAQLYSAQQKFEDAVTSASKALDLIKSINQVDSFTVNTFEGHVKWHKEKLANAKGGK